MKHGDVEEDLNRLSHAVIGAAIEVHRLLGPGFRESIYEEAMRVELGVRGMAFRQQVPVAVYYKGHKVGQGQLDLVVADAIVVELKAVDAIAEIHRIQLLSYLRATGCRVGLLINFDVPILRDGIRRVLHNPS
jgi:GxxExxY protein